MVKIKKAEEISLRINGGYTPGYLAVPNATTPVPGVIVIQEVWGLNDDIKRIARLFAEEGYAALSPDLYHGNESEEMEEALEAEFSEIDLKCSEAFVLVGGILCDGCESSEEARERLQGKRLDKYDGVLERINDDLERELPDAFRTPNGFPDDGRSASAGNSDGQ